MRQSPDPKVFYSNHYHIDLPPGHPFPMHKYRTLKDRLSKERLIGSANLVDPGLAKEEEILSVHTRDYWEKMRDGSLSKTELRKLGFPWSEALFRRSRAAVAGTIEATRSAFQAGLSINLAGGTHHSFPDRGSGYCVFNDVAIATVLQSRKPLDNKARRVMIVDLDAHQGNGNNFILGREERVYTLSAHVGSNFPREKHPGTLDIELPRGVKGDQYLAAVTEKLSFAVEMFEPELAIYIAGVDVHENDRFGQMSLTTLDMVERDRFTAGLFLERGIPLTIVLGGGYNKTEGMTVDLHFQTIKTALDLQKTHSIPLSGS